MEKFLNEVVENTIDIVDRIVGIKIEPDNKINNPNDVLIYFNKIEDKILNEIGGLPKRTNRYEFFPELAKMEGAQFYNGNNMLIAPGINVLGYVKAGDNCVFDGNSTFKGALFTGDNCEIRSGVYHQSGVVIIDHNSQIQDTSSLRGTIVIGSGTHVRGDIKRSYFGNKTNHGHPNGYIGDSVIGNYVNIAAGTVTANLRFDGKKVWMNVDGNEIEVDRKFGAVIEHYAKTGANSTLPPGAHLPEGMWYINGKDKNPENKSLEENVAEDVMHFQH